MDLGIALLALGTQVVKSACKLWLGDGFAGDVSDTVADLLQDQVPDAIQRHKLKGMFEGFAGTVAEKARRADDSRFHSLPENERVAAILAVAETFQKSELNDTALFAVNLDARALEGQLRTYVAAHSRAWGLSEKATHYFDLLLRECCSYLLEIKKTLPRFTSDTLTELLRRSSVIGQQLTEVLERLPARTSMSGDEGFETDYRRQVASELDYMDLFGATAFERNRGYQLSVAYISLIVSEMRGAAAQLRGIPIESVLAASPRVFIRGEAGSGKTTLLQWIAVSAARREFPDELSAWNDLVPFFLRLRQFADSGKLPRPEEFIRVGTAMALSEQMPDQWVHRILKAGRGIVLIDGVDEVHRSQRPRIFEWLRQLAAAFPRARVVVTSRPAAVTEDWLERQGFRSCFIQPMTPSDVERFIGHWHRAMALTMVENAAKQELEDLSLALSKQVSAKRYLRQLATNPLLCALLCALNRDRRAELPTNRIELFRISLEMFLQRRDSERPLPTTAVRMDYEDKLQLLQDLAYWMMMNGLAIAERDRVTDLVSTQLVPRRHRVAGTAHEVVEHLLERSGVIREPVAGSIDFIHRSFQEYLAAQEAMDQDHIEALIERATDEQWRQVVILAAGVGNKRQTKKIFEGLLNPPRRLRSDKLALELTALGCLETAIEVDPDVADHIKREAGSLIPPRSAEHVNLLRKVGEYAYDLLADVRVEDRDALPYMTQVASMLGGSLGVKLLERISEGLSPHLDNKEFTNILIRLWPEFDLIEFADHLLARRDIRYLEANSPEMLRAISRVPSVEILECQLPSDFTDYTILAKMPRLSKATILVSPDQRGLSIATFPSRPREVMLMNWTPKAFYNRYSYERQVSSTPAYRTLTISRLDALPLLRSLALGDNFEELVIQGDGGIADLRDLSLPPSIVALEVTECPSFSQLDGVAELAGSQLRDLRVEIGQSMTSLTGLTQPLFWVTEINDDPLIKQLRLLKISFVDSSSINTQELDMLKSNISGYGFTVDGDGHSGITAQR